MSAFASNPALDASVADAPPDGLWRRAMGSRRVAVGGSVLLIILLPCLVSMPWTLDQTNRTPGSLYYDNQDSSRARQSPNAERLSVWFGTDQLGRSLLGRVLLGGVISLAIGLGAAAISISLGVSVGMLAGYRGGWVDSLLMRTVDVLYGLPYILLIILLKIALEPVLKTVFSPQTANMTVLFLAIGLVSWLTMARIVRGQVLSLRAQPFIEACRAGGLTEGRIFLRHLLPNLLGPITVYATLTIPQAILQESFLSFLGIGIQAPMPTWGSLASEGLLPALNPLHHRWWMLVIPCTLLAITLLSLNFLGDGLRDVFDPKREAAKI
jgi:ABC-type dipeptide/oligopeptide/nickel transport system permease subunit